MSRLQTWGRGTLAALALLLITGSLLPLWWTDLWWVRLWDFPRLQVVGLLFIAAIARSNRSNSIRPRFFASQ